MNGQTPKFCKASYFTNLCGSNHGKHAVSREYLAILDKADGIVGHIAQRKPQKMSGRLQRSKQADILADTNTAGAVTVDYKP